LPLAILRTFWLDHPWWSFFSYDDLYPWSTQSEMVKLGPSFHRA
jgi:hypothetical protein